MSWEGYGQNWCEKGHYFIGPAGYDGDPTHCNCGAKIQIGQIVDNTNGLEDAVIPPHVVESLLLEAEEVQTCNMGHQHVTKRACYRVPSKEELSSLAHWWDSEGNCYRPISECVKHLPFYVMGPGSCGRCGGLVQS